MNSAPFCYREKLIYVPAVHKLWEVTGGENEVVDTSGLNEFPLQGGWTPP